MSECWHYNRYALYYGKTVRLLKGTTFSKPCNNGSDAGCEYPGEAGFNPINDWEGGEKWCVVTTKTESKRLENESDFTVLWNHRHGVF